MKQDKIIQNTAWDEQKDAIVSYYEECDNAYRDAWGMDQNMQLNLGIWNKDTKKLSEALVNLNNEMIQDRKSVV